MGKGISEVLTYAVGVAISPVPIIAVTLMLFSRRARENGSLFLLGWVVALAVVCGVAYAAADEANAATDSTTADTIAWGKIVFGVLLLLLAARTGAPARHPVPSRRCRNGWQASTLSSRSRRSASVFCWPESTRRT